MGMDGRISPKFLHPGPGYGGSCFPQDTRAIAATGDEFGVDMSLIKEVVSANEKQKERVADRLIFLTGPVKGRTVCVLGLAFKAETDDVRESPAITIVERLLEHGATVHAHDPEAAANFRAIFGDRVTLFDTDFEAIAGADALLIVTEWNEYRNLDLERTREIMRGNIIFDTRNVLDAEKARSMGFIYAGIGRP